MATNYWTTCKANQSKHTSTWQPIVGPLVSQNSQNRHPHGNKLLDLVSQISFKGLPCGNHLLEQFINKVSHIRHAMWHPIIGQ